MNFLIIKNKIKNIFTIKKIVILISFIILFIFVIFGILKYKNYLRIKHEKNAITASMELPRYYYQEDNIPSIYMEFSKPVVALENTEKEFKDGISISPKISGKFTFISPTYLKFTPENNWKPDTEYKVLFNKKVENFKKLKKLDYTFSTPLNKPYITNYIFYENPLNVKERKIIGTLVFPYPTEIKDIEKNISLESSDEKISYSLKSNDKKTEIYITSDPILIKDKEEYIVLSYKIKKNEIKDRIRIPSAKDYFKFSSFSSSTIFNSDKQEEEQILVFSFSRPVDVVKTVNSINLSKSNIGGCYYGNLKKLKEKAVNLPFENLTNNAKYSKIITLKIDVLDYSNTCILANLKNQLTSEDGFVLNDNDIKVTRAPSFTKDVKVVFDGVIVNSDDDKSLTFVSRGYEALQIEINRLNEDSINHLITQTSGDFKNADFNNYYFNEDNISEKFFETIYLNKMHPAKSNYSSINLKKYLKGKKGLFIVKANGYDPETKSKLGRTDRRLIIVTDIGIMVKTNLNSTKDLFISSLKSGVPISGAKVDVVGKNGIVISTKYTNRDGHISFQSFDEYKNEKMPVAYIVNNSGDISFIPYRKYDRELNYSGFNVGGVYQYENSRTSNAKTFIFTDRDLYRPGETIQMGFILKDKDLGKLPSDMPLEIVLRDSSYNEVYNKKIQNGTGFFSLSLDTKSTMQTGEYTIYLYLVNNKGHRDSFLTSKNIKIEEFQPDRMKLLIAFDNVSKNGWYKDKNLKGDIKLENLFGAPAQNRLIKTTVEVRPINFYFQEYKDYKFTDLWKEDLYKTQTIVEERPEETTDDNGLVKFDIDLSKYINGTYSLSLTAEGFEPDGGRSVVGLKYALISPLNYIVGYKSNSDLKYIKKDTEHTVELIALNNKLNKIDVKDLKVITKKITYESVLTQDAAGNLRYQKEKTFKDISSDNLEISKTGTNIKLPTNIVGEIQVEIVDSNQNKLAIINYNVVGRGNSTFSIDKNAELKLILNKNEYNTGDIIEMSITSPYAGYGIITIERDKVYAYKWFKTDSNNTVQTIRIPENLDGNAYVNVSFMRDINSKEIFISPLSYAVAPFSINKSKFEVKIDLDTPTKVKPGDTLNINYKMNKDADIVIYGVDEGILQVAKYNLPNPLAEFTKKLALQVTTSQIFDLVLPSFQIIKEISGVGGGEAFDEISKMLNPFARKVNKPVAFWSGIITGTKEGSYEYKIPDYFNGKLRIMAVAVGDSSLGSAQTFVNSQADIVLLPNVPVSISPNDEIEVSVGIGNYVEYSGKDAKFSVNINTSDNLQVLGNKTQKVTVQENHEKTVKFNVKALTKLGNAEIKFEATCENCSNYFKNSISSTLSLRPSCPYQVLIETGKAKTKTIKDIKLLYNEYSDSKLVVSPSPILIARGLVDFLNEYPHGCSEQITSRVFSIMLLKSKYPGIISNEKFDKLLNDTISELSQRQNNDGGFLAWPSNNYYNLETNVFHTLYVMHFLTFAKTTNYYVPDNTFNRGIEWIKNFVSNNPSDSDDLRNKAYGIYILTLNGILPTANLVSLEKFIKDEYDESLDNDVTGIYMAATYKMMQDDKKANSIINRFKFREGKEYYSSYDTDDLRNVQYIYITSLYFPDIFAKIKDKSADILLNIVKENRYNTLLSTYAVIALRNFTDNITADNVLFTAKNKANKINIDKVMVNPFTAILVPNGNITEVSFSNKDSLYYSFIQKGFIQESSHKAFSKNIEVAKRVLNKEGKEIKSAKQGDEVTISIKIQNLKGNFIENLAIVDLLPSGFEIKEVVKSDNMFSFNLREDRFLGYAWLSNDMIEISYIAKATTKGKLVLPAIFVQDMYNNESAAQSNSSEFIVN